MDATRLGMWIAIGIAVGVAFGSAFGNVGLGVAFGPLIGIVVWVLESTFRQKDSAEESEDPDGPRQS